MKKLVTKTEKDNYFNNIFNFYINDYYILNTYKLKKINKTFYLIALFLILYYGDNLDLIVGNDNWIKFNEILRSNSNCV
jgi:hypothetical protein